MAEALILQSLPESIEYTSSSAVSKGEILYLDGVGAMVAHDTYGASVKGTYYVRNIDIKVELATGENPAQGDLIFWDVSANKAAKSNYASLTYGDFAIGTAVETATASGGYVRVALNSNKTNKYQTALIAVEDLTAGLDITTREIFIVPHCACTLISVGILTDGAPAGVDDSNTSVFTIADDAANTIVTKTYNTATQPPTSDYESLGTLSTTHKLLTPGEHVTLTVTNGTTANLPAFTIVIVYNPAF